MAQLALAHLVLIVLTFSTGIVSTIAEGNDLHPTINDGRRSSVCLIEMVAHKNKIQAEYNFKGMTPTNKTITFTYDLILGNENYTGAATSKKKAKEAVAGTAYEKTHYEKPEIKGRMCIIAANLRTDLSVLYEYATILNTTLAIQDKQIAVTPPKFEITLALDGKSTTVTGFKKATIKQQAAAQLLAGLGREHVMHAMVMRYNAPKYHQMSSTERLNKIVFATQNEDAKYSVVEEPNNNNGRRYKVNVWAQNVETTGVGETLEKANEDGAKNVLEHLHLTVL